MCLLKLNAKCKHIKFCSLALVRMSVTSSGSRNERKVGRWYAGLRR